MIKIIGTNSNSWIMGFLDSDIDKNKFETFGLANKSGYFYRNRMSAGFFALFAVPLCILSFSIRRATSTHTFPAFLIGAVLGLALVPFVFIYRRKKYAYFTNLELKNNGREILINDNQILFSSGELARGSENTFFFYGIKILDLVEKYRISYVGLNFGDCESFKLNQDVLTLIPKDKMFGKFVIKIGNISADAQALSNIEKALKKNLKRMVA
jgi:hypothetical protein